MSAGPAMHGGGVSGGAGAAGGAAAQVFSILAVEPNEHVQRMVHAWLDT
jgi:hypothetical protein